VGGDPQTSVACLKCHATGYAQPASGASERYSVHEGVGCEACHGAGSQYSPEAVMKDKAKAQAAGLKQITRDTCLTCHADAHGKPFDYEKAVAQIAHPTRFPANKTGTVPFTDRGTVPVLLRRRKSATKRR